MKVFEPFRKFEPMMMSRRGGGTPLADYDGLYFLDDFSNGPVAAGSVHGTSTPDGLAKRYLADTGNNLSISTALDCAGAVSTQDPNIRYRTAADGPWNFAKDDAYLFAVSPDGSGYPKSMWRCGYDTNITGPAGDPGIDASIDTMRMDAYPTEDGSEKSFDLDYDDTSKLQYMLYKIADGGGFLLLELDSGIRWRVRQASQLPHGGTLAYPVWAVRSTTYVFDGAVNLIAAAAMPTDWVGTVEVMTNPSATDTGTMPDADSFIMISNITVPSAGEIQIEFRKDGDDEVTLAIDSTGTAIIRENGVDRITGSAGEVANGENFRLEIVGDEVRSWPHDQKNYDSYDGLEVLFGTGINVVSLGTGGAVGEIRVWETWHDAPFEMP